MALYHNSKWISKTIILTPGRPESPGLPARPGKPASPSKPVKNVCVELKKKRYQLFNCQLIQLKKLFKKDRNYALENYWLQNLCRIIRKNLNFKF